ncbi:Hypothetical predicted protein, partial [Pelobates cultripes]
DGSVRRGSGWQTEFWRWGIRKEQDPSRLSSCSGGNPSSLQTVQSSKGKDYGFIQPYPGQTELFH